MPADLKVGRSTWGHRDSRSTGGGNRGRGVFVSFPMPLDARGLAIFDAAVRDFKFTLRSFRRAPLTGLTIVLTVGLGLGLVAAVFTVLNAFVFRPDDVRNAHEVVSIVRPQPGTSEPEPSFTVGQFDTLLRETSVFSQAFATTRDVDAWIDGQRREGRLVTGNFFQVLGVSAARGRVFTPLDDEPGRSPAIVLSHRAWSQHFAGDPDIAGRTVRVNGTPSQIVGVMPETFRGLELAAPDYWAPIATIQHFRRDATTLPDVPVDIVGRLAPGISPGQALAQVHAWDVQRRASSMGEVVERLVVEPRMGTIPLSFDTLAAFTPLFFAFGLILLIGCANVANLLLARGIARQQEIGVRLAIGASRRRVISQLLIESLLLALVSAVLAFGISRLVLEGVVYALVSTFPPGLGNLRLAVPDADWRVGLFLLAGALASTVSFGLAPAFQTTRLDLVRAIRGEFARAAGPGRPRRALVVVQVTGSALLLICAAIFLRSSWSAARVESGIRTDGIVTIEVLNEDSRRAVLDIVGNEPTTARVAGAWPGVVGGRPAVAAGTAGTATVTYQFVSPDYFGVLGVDIVRGRGFAADEDTSNNAVAVVSESTARQLWPGGDAIGQTLRLESGAATSPLAPEGPPAIAGRFTVVGVARDVAGFRIGAFRTRGAGVYVPIAPEAAGTTLIVAARGDTERARRSMADRMASIDPNLTDIDTLERLAASEAYLLAIPFWLTLALGALALLLTLSGLFSVLSYLVEQRTREIGVRMALGATRGSVATLVLSQLSGPVGLGLLLGGGLTFALGRLLLSTSAAEVIGETVRLSDPLAFAGSLLCIVAACLAAALVPAWRAARISPLVAIRRE